MNRLYSFLVVLLLSITALAEPTRIRDVIYEHKFGVALTMDVFKPAKPNGIGVIMIISGGWVSNHNNINPRAAQALTDRGMTVFAVVHGSQPKFTVQEIVPDVRRAVRFIRTHAAEYGVNPNKLGITGGSAGGHLSLMVAAYGVPGDKNAKDPVDRAGSEVEAVAVFFPPTDFLNWGKVGQSAMQMPGLRPFWPAFGVSDKTSEAQLQKLGHDLSPIYGNLAKMPPTLVIHGDKDFLVPLQQSQLLIAKLDELKVPHRLDIRKGKGHGWQGMENDYPEIADWFMKYLGDTAVSPK